MDPIDTTAVEAAAFRRLRAHLMQERPDVQNIDLMILAGFCRNCLADWYREAAENKGIGMTRDEAREAVYGMPFAEFKARHQAEATPEPMAAPGACQRWTGTSAFIVLDKSWQGATWQSRANVRNAASGSCT